MRVPPLRGQPVDEDGPRPPLRNGAWWWDTVCGALSVVVADFLAALPAPARERVLAAARVRRYPKGQVICHEGDRGDSLYVIRSGRVAIRVSTEHGDVMTLSVLGPGESFGEMALIRPEGLRTATAVALSEVESVILLRTVFDELRRADPTVERLVMEALAARVDRLSKLLLEAYREDVPHRCIRRLAELVPQGGDRTAEVPITQEELASLAGATRPSANQALKRLEARGLIRLGRGRIIVNNVAALHRLAGH